MHSLLKHVTAGLLALSLAFTPAPALAAGSDQDEVAQFLMLLAVLGLVGAALDRDDDDPKDHARHDGRPHPGSSAHGHRPGDRGHVILRSTTLPRACTRQFHGTGGNLRTVSDRTCLQSHYSGFHRLPRECLRLVTLSGRTREAYGARCLERRGFTVPRH